MYKWSKQNACVLSGRDGFRLAGQPVCTVMDRKVNNTAADILHERYACEYAGALFN